MTVAGRRGAAMHHHFTFRRSAGGFAEDLLIRGLHPLHRAAARTAAAGQLRPHPAAVGGRGRLPVPLRGPAEPGRRAAGRHGRGAGPDPAAGRRGADDRAARGRGRARRVPGRDPQGPGPAAGEQAARRQPDLHLRVAAERADRRRAERHRPAGRAHDGGRGPRGGHVPGPAAGSRDRPDARRRGADLLPRGVRRARRAGRAVGRADRAARRLRPEGAARPPPRHRLPVRADRRAGRAGRVVRRARPRRRRRAGAGRPRRGATTRPPSWRAW